MIYQNLVGRVPVGFSPLIPLYDCSGEVEVTALDKLPDAIITCEDGSQPNAKRLKLDDSLEAR